MYIPFKKAGHCALAYFTYGVTGRDKHKDYTGNRGSTDRRSV